MPTQQRGETAPRAVSGRAGGTTGPDAPSREREGGKKLTYKDQRDYDLLPARIEAIEAAIARDEAALSDPDLYARDPKRFAALTAAIETARAEKDAAELRWLELAERVEAMGG
jgi:ATP-binding cassette subfamily F protein uup